MLLTRSGICLWSRVVCDLYVVPEQAVVSAFRETLARRGLSAFVRTPRGDDISAACGQLGAEVSRLPVVS